MVFDADSRLNIRKILLIASDKIMNDLVAVHSRQSKILQRTALRTRTEGRSLKNLGLAGMNRDQIIHYFITGNK